MITPIPITYEYLTVAKGKLTDRQILGTAVQPGDDFVDTDDTYSWYYAVGKLKSPQHILELGIRYGYAGIAMMKGAHDASVCSYYVGVDSEADGIESNDIARLNLYRYGRGTDFVTSHMEDSDEIEDVCILKLDTQKTAEVVSKIGEYHNRFDIVHVDGDHSEQGLASELWIAECRINPDGLILVDDIDTPRIRGTVDAFCDELEITPIELPTRHGLYVIDMRKQARYS